MEDLDIWQGVIQFSSDEEYRRWNHYFKFWERPLYDSLIGSKLEGISVLEFYWHEKQTTQKDLEHKVDNLAYLPPVNWSEIRKQQGTVVINFRVGPK